MASSPVATSLTADLATDGEVTAVKRTRRGEKFTPANQVNLHANDFEWVDLLAELSDEDAALYRTFRAKCVERLANVRLRLQKGAPQCDQCFYPLGHPTAGRSTGDSGALHTEVTTTSSSLPIAAATTRLAADVGTAVHVHDPQQWERHYTTNKQHFPVKNYIVHAFPSLIPRVHENESSMEALNRLCSAASVLDHAESLDQVIEGKAAPSSPPTTTSPVSDAPRRIVMEAGCGTGSVTHPLMKLFPNDYFVCHDVSGTAVEILRSHPFAQSHAAAGTLQAFVLDLTEAGHAVENAMARHCQAIRNGSVDFVLLVFVLSAMPSMEHMVHVLRQLRSFLKPKTGRLLFRDYGALDHNFFRFHRQDNMFIESSLNFLKGDGTEQFFFDVATTEELFALAGLVPAAPMVYHCNRIVNRKNGKRMDKVFVNGEFIVGDAAAVVAA